MLSVAAASRRTLTARPSSASPSSFSPSPARSATVRAVASLSAVAAAAPPSGLVVMPRRSVAVTVLAAAASQPRVVSPHRALHSSAVGRAAGGGGGRAAPTSGPITFNLTDVGEGIAECEILQWFVQPGDKVQRFDRIAEVQSDKATVEITSPYQGTILALHHKKGDMAKVHKPLFDIHLGDGVPAAASEAPPQPPSDVAASLSAAAGTDIPKTNAAATADSEHERILTAPAVRRIAKENNVDLRLVKGTGPTGRILKGDVQAYVDNGGAAAAAAASTHDAKGASSPSAAAGAASAAPADRRVPVRGLTRTMIKTMTAAALVPQFGYADEVVMDNLVAFKDSLKPLAKAEGVKMTFMPIFIKAVSMALKKYPILNSSLSPDQSEIIYHGSHNIGFAVDTPNGLIVPNVKNVQALTLVEIAKELSRLISAAQDGKLATADLTGGTLTLSNIGSIGGTYCSPVVLLPEVCIAALGRMQTVPRFAKDGSVTPVRIMNVGWSADHRIIDGATVANFSNAWKRYLEEPALMAAEMV